MRRVMVSELGGNEILGRHLFDNLGNTLLASGTLLDASMVKRLEIYGIQEIFIEDEVSREVEVESVLSEATKIELKRCISTTIDKFIRAENGNFKEISKILEDTIDEVLLNQDVMVMVNEIRMADNYIFEHSSNVAATSILLGIKTGLKKGELKELAEGALLHDYGKIHLLNRMGKKYSELDHEELERLEKDHCEAGHRIIHDFPGFSKTTRNIILLHHEHMDGSGFPYFLKGEQTQKEVKIVTICSDFDNLIYGNRLIAPIPAHKATELIAHSTDKYDYELAKVFVGFVASYPNGMSVRLSTGEYALVVRQNSSAPSRPIVRVISDKDGNKIQHYEINLMKNLTVFISL